jgi:hypothetical protein
MRARAEAAAGGGIGARARRLPPSSPSAPPSPLLPAFLFPLSPLSPHTHSTLYTHLVLKNNRASSKFERRPTPNTHTNKAPVCRAPLPPLVAASQVQHRHTRQASTQQLPLSPPSAHAHVRRPPESEKKEEEARERERRLRTLSSLFFLSLLSA